jgi:hypothetical protein
MSSTADIAECLSSLAACLTGNSGGTSSDAPSALSRAILAAAAALHGIDDARALDVARTLVARGAVGGVPQSPPVDVEYTTPPECLNSWAFDVFALPLIGLSASPAAGASPPSADEAALGEARLEAVALDLVCQSAAPLPVPRDAARSFVRAVRATYAPRPFHNWYHGVSVAHATLLLLSADGARHLGALHRLAAVLAALSHDAGHTGHTNAFEVATACAGSLAHVHADAVLERNSAHLLCDALAVSGVLRGLPAADARAVRATAVSAILGTDMCRHGRSVAAAAEVDSSRLAAGDAHAHETLVELIVHTADLSGFSYAPRETCVQWSSRILLEFRLTAEEEVRRGLRSAAATEGSTPRADAAAQASFIRHIVLPLWVAMRGVLGDAVDEPLSNIRANEREFEKWSA